ncbi:hypothetical protein LTR37_019696 [Vermiconidia calcicola]|uniref:Uncharacterized protein n=1 Tax=Vermiconidia calcicola TaxID=1690605 RepID=A0ACC3MDD2_9PEZI|nr:hypothetical protein LTR37_019696 [Vermiconidia calcicola]
MRLLHTETYELVDVEELAEKPPYAILSHRWKGKEIVFKDLSSAPLSPFERRAESFKSFTKIKEACARAKEHELNYIWIDTCCIDKSSSEELRKELNSMFKWYHEAQICYTFLFDVTFSGRNERMFDSNLKHRKEKENPRDQASEWFERGWTLQELLAPVRMEFYDQHWKSMGTRDEHAVLPKTSVPRGERRGETSWMAGRVTRDVEDIAYSLLGIFNVNLIPQYGEGHKAFSRLQETIVAGTGSFDESLFAWQLPDNGELKCYRKVKPQPEKDPVESIPKFEDSNWGLLAPSPDCFEQSTDVVILQDKLRSRIGAGFQTTHQGIFVTLPYPKLLADECGKLEGDKSAKVGNTRSKMAGGRDQGPMYTAPITISQPQIDLIYPEVR